MVATGWRPSDVLRLLAVVPCQGKAWMGKWLRWHEDGGQTHFPFWGSWEDGFPFPKVGCGLVPWSQECSDVLQKIFHGSSTNPPSLTYSLPQKEVFYGAFVVEGCLNSHKHIPYCLCCPKFQTSNFLMEGFHLYLEGCDTDNLAHPPPRGICWCESTMQQALGVSNAELTFNLPNVPCLEWYCWWLRAKRKLPGMHQTLPKWRQWGWSSFMFPGRNLRIDLRCFSVDGRVDVPPVILQT